jgi:hypothetical protein
MTIYHGSNVVVVHPALTHSVRTLDFGAGFYTTTNKKQAIRFTNTVVKRNGGRRIINVYDFDKERAFSTLKTLQFKTADKAWLDFINQNRNGFYNGEKYDIISGPVADDRVYRTLVLYGDGTYSFEEALAKLSAFKLYNQIVFTGEAALPFLHFARSEVIDGRKDDKH